MGKKALLLGSQVELPFLERELEEEPWWEWQMLIHLSLNLGQKKMQKESVLGLELQLVPALGFSSFFSRADLLCYESHQTGASLRKLLKNSNSSEIIRLHSILEGNHVTYTFFRGSRNP